MLTKPVIKPRRIPWLRSLGPYHTRNIGAPFLFIFPTHELQLRGGEIRGKSRVGRDPRIVRRTDSVEKYDIGRLAIIACLRAQMEGKWRANAHEMCLDVARNGLGKGIALAMRLLLECGWAWGAGGTSVDRVGRYYIFHLNLSAA
jgi:hypothetical protein